MSSELQSDVRSGPSVECLWGEGPMWLIGAVVCSLAAYHGSSCSLARAMDGRI